MAYYEVEFIAEADIEQKSYRRGDKALLSEWEYRSANLSCKLITKHNTLPEERVKSSVIQRAINNIRRKQEIAIITAAEIKANKAKAKRILIVKTDGLGNIINMSPVIEKARELLPDCEIDFLGESIGKEVFKGWDCLDNIYAYPEDIEAIKRNRYDFILNGIYDTWKVWEWPEFNETEIFSADDTNIKHMSETEVNMAILRPFGWDGAGIPHTHVEVDEVEGYKGKKHIAVCAGYRADPPGAWKFKNWGCERFGELVGALQGKYPDHKILVLGTGEEGKVLDHVKDKAGVINCVGKYNIRETAYILSRCKFIVCNDTGLGHIASAMDVKSFVIFGATSAVKNKPQNKAVVIQNQVKCRPCQFKEKFMICKTLECMNITPETVMSAVTGEKQYRYGMIIPIYNRYLLASVALDSVLKIKGLTRIKIVLIDDGSTQESIPGLIERFKAAAQGLGNTVEVIKHEENYGAKGYLRTVREGFDACRDCEYIIFGSSDILINSEFLNVAEKSLRYFSDVNKCLSFFKDGRGYGWIAEDDMEVDQNFDYHFFDGVLGLFRRKDIELIKWDMLSGENAVWLKITDYFLSRGWKFLAYKQALAEHIGDIQSAMHPEYREEKSLRAINLNLWERPGILNAEC